MDQVRTRIALTVISIGFAGITLVSAVTLLVTSDKDGSSRLVFAAVLPLFGTWVGAVLAFYFSRENQQAASDTTLDALESVRAATGTRGGTLVDQVMIPIERVNPREDVADLDAAGQLPLRSLYAAMRSSGCSRVPVFANQTALLVVHEPDIDKYAQDKQVKADDLPATETVAQLLSDAALGHQVTAFVAVPPTATLTEARRQMSRVADCKDVFVTVDGLKSGAVRGWLTNSDLARTD